jgi:hypothetical protein
MKNKIAHVWTFLLIILMIIFAVATTCVSGPDSRIPDRVSYENNEGYFYIKIETINNPDEYILSEYSFSLYFEIDDCGKRYTQIFTNIANENGTFEVYVLYPPPPPKPTPLEKKFYEKPSFDIYAENNFIIIKIKEEIIYYKSPYAPNIEMNHISGERELYRGF